MYFWTTLTLLYSSFSYDVICNPVIPCKLTDQKCLEKTSAAVYSQFIVGDPELGTENLDPMYHDVIEGNMSVLKYKLTNNTIKGFKDCEIENVKLNAGLHSLHINLLCPKFIIYGLYDMSGRLIELSVEGKGDYRIETNKYHLLIDAELKLAPGKDGKTYISVKNFKQTAEPLENVNFDFKNLFNGQKDLADPFLKHANEKWYEVAKEIQEPIFKANIKKLFKNANKYFKKFSMEDLLSF